jgi:hypothetical protein
MSLEQMRRALDKIAHDAGFQPEDAYFIRGEFKIETTTPEGAGATLYTDEGLNYCCDCATDLVAKARAHALDAAGTDEKARETAAESFDDNHRVVFTQLHQEDGSMQCEECRRTIDYALSENGFFAELDHYEGVQFDEKLLPGDAYAIARLIDALSVVKEDYDVDVDDEEDLLVELEALDLDYEYDRERAKEIERELAKHRSGEPKVRDLSTEERAIAVAERALALVNARSPAAPVCWIS